MSVLAHFTVPIWVQIGFTALIVVPAILAIGLVVFICAVVVDACRRK